MTQLLIVLMFVFLYGFIGYPCLLYVLTKIIKNRINRKEREDLTVTMIIAAYNEEDVIAAKLKNTLNLSYPGEKLEIIVASDGSTDRTDEIVKSFSEKGIVLKRVEGRKGKTEAQNQCVKIASGEIILFSDANAFYSKNAIRKIIRNFNDDKVGGVCGNLVYYNEKDKSDDHENTYWKFEKFLKQKESDLGTLLGANGSIYAIRKDLYVPLANHLISDLVEPLKVVQKGYRFVYENEAISLEIFDTDTFSQAYNRKVRINVRSIIGLYHSRFLINLTKYGFTTIQFLSHKVLRYLMPFLLIAVFVVNIYCLKTLFFWCFVLFGLQVICYSAAILGFIRRNEEKSNKFIDTPWYFLWTHIAILNAFYRLIRGDRKITWDTVRKNF